MDVPFAAELSHHLAIAGLPPLHSVQMAQFESYYELFLRWNARTNLSAIRDREGILSRHFVESIACAQALPSGIATLLDFGSGGGFPGVPIAICHPEIAVTLAESQGKKAAFLSEVVRTLGVSALVHAGRAESLTSGFDCVTLRAVDRMAHALEVAAALVLPGGYLAWVTTEQDAGSPPAFLTDFFTGTAQVHLSGSNFGVLCLARRVAERS